MAARTLRLTFDGASKKVADKIRANVSGLAVDGRNLWVGGDEGRSVERLTLVDGEFRNHLRFDLADFLSLDTAHNQDEIDIEGIDIDDDYLWLVGSFSLKRKKPDPDATVEDNLLALADVSAQANRYTLARVPLQEDGEDRILVRSTAGRAAAKLATGAIGNALTDALLDDQHLGPFLSVPSKDNGLDIEGLAVRGNRVWLGLRGPVLRGWAVVLQLRLDDGEQQATLQLRSLGNNRRYRKHFLQLDGLGIRDLLLDGEDLLVLAGPTMTANGPHHLFRWKTATKVESDSLTWRSNLEHVLALPDVDGDDHAEAIAWLGKRQVLVGYDSPHKSRLEGNQSVTLDVLDMPKRST